MSPFSGRCCTHLRPNDNDELQRLQRLAAELEERAQASRIAGGDREACREAYADGATIEMIADITQYHRHIHDVVYESTADHSRSDQGLDRRRRPSSLGCSVAGAG